MLTVYIHIARYTLFHKIYKIELSKFTKPFIEFIYTNSKINVHGFVNEKKSVAIYKQC